MSAEKYASGDSANVWNVFVAAIHAGDLIKLQRYLNIQPGLVHASDEYGDTALLHGVRGRDTAVVELLLDNGADINQTHDYGPLYEAAWGGDATVVRFLLEHEADPEAVVEGGLGWIPLHGAANFLGTREVLQLLVDAGSSVEATCKDCYLGGPTGVTALHLASDSGNLAAIEFLLAHGVDVDVRDDWGRTPLRRLVERRGRVDDARKDPLTDTERAVIDFLLDSGANINACDHRDVSPLAFAIGPSGNTAYEKYLRAREAKLSGEGN